MKEEDKVRRMTEEVVPKKTIGEESLEKVKDQEGLEKVKDQGDLGTKSGR